MIVEFGVTTAIERDIDPHTGEETDSRVIEGTRVAYFGPTPDGQSLGETFTAITAPVRGFYAHSVGEEPPVWVYSDEPALQHLLAVHYECDEGRPDDVEATHHTEAGPPGIGWDEDGNPVEVTAARRGRGPSGSAGSITTMLGLCVGLVVLAVAWVSTQLQIRTTAGMDWLAAVMGSTSQPAAANWVAITNNNAAPLIGDTTLAGEVTTAGGTLIRKQGTFGHVAGVANYTITTVLTANGTDVLPFVGRKIGVFTASSGGTMAFETLLNADANFNVPGDQSTITETVSI